MASELLLWFISFAAVIALIGLDGYQILQYSEFLLEGVFMAESFTFKWQFSPALLQFSYFTNLSSCTRFLKLLICLSDLEFDYINPYDSSSRINAVVIPEFMVQSILCILFLLTWHWFPFLLMAPITYYHLRLYMRRKHLVDVTEIFRLLNGEKKYRLIKLALYCSMLFIVIYRLVTTAVLLLIEEDGTLETEIF